MNVRLQQFLSAENISQAQLADTIGVARASISHILAGRNKPGFDFIESMARHYPEISLEWLICGKGKMYKAASEKHQASSPSNELDDIAEQTLFQDIESKEIINTENSPGPSSENETMPVSAARPEPKQATEGQTTSPPLQKVRAISKIVIFYDDNTYQELKLIC